MHEPTARYKNASAPLAENGAVRRHRPLYIKVMVFECKTDEQIRDFVVDIANGSRQQWLYDLVLWATLNGKEVQLVNKKDDRE